MGVSFKAGHNGESHNHNDVGSYTLAVGEETLAGDMGGPFSYPGDYFDNGSYKYPIKNSFGHPLPVVDGNLQQTGKSAQGKILHTAMSQTVDSCLLDLTAAYAQTTSLHQLTRQFVYDRTGKGSFSIEDRYSAEAPIAFETAITTRASWKTIGKDMLELTSGKETVRIRIEASAPVSFTSETIEVNCPPYTRIGIVMKDKARNGYIRMVMM